MQDVIWPVIGFLAGWRSFVMAERDVVELRLSGETFGSGRLSEFVALSVPTAAVSAAMWWGASQRFNHDITVLCFGLLVSIGLRLFIIDVDTHLLPRRIIHRGTALALPMLFIAALLDSEGSIIGMLLGAVIMWGVMKVLAILSRGDLGAGDVRLSILLGLYVGWVSLSKIATALVIAFALAGLFALFLLAFRLAGRRTHIAFGPFLIVGALFAVLR